MLPPLEHGIFCFDPVWDKQRALDLIEHYATAFLLDALNTDKDARAALLPGGPQTYGRPLRDDARVDPCRTHASAALRDTIHRRAVRRDVGDDR